MPSIFSIFETVKGKKVNISCDTGGQNLKSYSANPKLPLSKSKSADTSDKQIDQTQTRRARLYNTPYFSCGTLSFALVTCTLSNDFT